MNDLTIKCRDCGKDFVVNAGEQKWLKEKGLLMPKRCRDCRVKKRAEYYAKENEQS